MRRLCFETKEMRKGAQLLRPQKVPVLGKILLKMSKKIWKELMVRSNRPEVVFFQKGVLKICSKFTGEHPCWSAISIKLLCTFIEIRFWHGCFPVIFRTPFLKNNSGRLLLNGIVIHGISMANCNWDVFYEVLHSC